MIIHLAQTSQNIKPIFVETNEELKKVLYELLTSLTALFQRINSNQINNLSLELQNEILEIYKKELNIFTKGLTGMSITKEVDDLFFKFTKLVTKNRWYALVEQIVLQQKNEQIMLATIENIISQENNIVQMIIEEINEQIIAEINEFFEVIKNNNNDIITRFKCAVKIVQMRL